MDPAVKSLIKRGSLFAIISLAVIILIYTQTAVHPWASTMSYMILTFPTVVIFFLLTRYKIAKIKIEPATWEIIMWVVIAAVMFIFRLYLDFSFLRKFWTLGGVAALFLAFFGIKFLWALRREVLISLVVLIALWNLNFFVAWDYLGRFVSNAVVGLLNITGIPASMSMVITENHEDLWSPLITTETFSVLIIRGCAGVQSLAIFIVMFIAAIAIDFQKLRPRLIIPVFLVGLALTMLIVILRIYTLIWFGANGQAELAMTALHNTLGMFLFIVYFIVFLVVSFRIMRKKPAELAKLNKK